MSASAWIAIAAVTLLLFLVFIRQEIKWREREKLVAAERRQREAEWTERMRESRARVDRARATRDLNADRRRALHLVQYNPNVPRAIARPYDGPRPTPPERVTRPVKVRYDRG